MDVVEEIETLRGVYGDDAFAEGVYGDGGRWCEVRFEGRGGGGCVAVVVRVQVRPGAAAPEVEVVDSSRVLDLAAVRADVDDIGWAPGEASLFRVAEAVRGRVTEWEEAGGGRPEDKVEEEEEGDMGVQSRAKAEGPEAPPAPPGLVLAVGPPVVDRKSCFQCFVGTPVSSLEDVAAARDALMRSSSKVGRATHIMSAYRFTTSAGHVVADCDDGGESGAGKRLAFILERSGRGGGGGVVVFCCRWHGGVQLGPVRFAHIQNAARGALAQLGPCT